MNTDDIFVRSRKVAAEILDIPEESISMNSRFIDDLNVDSLFLTQLAVGMEEEFKIRVEDEDTKTMVTFQEMVDYIEARLAV